VRRQGGRGGRKKEEETVKGEKGKNTVKETEIKKK